MPKNPQTTVQLCLFHMLARLCLKSVKLGFSNTWTENFQMYKLDLEKTEEPEIKFPTFIGSWRKQGSFRKTPTPTSLTVLKSFTMWITIHCEKFFKRWEYQTTLPVSWETMYTGQEAAVRTRHGTTDWFKIGNGVQQGCILSHCVFNFYMWNAGLDEAQPGIKMAGRHINNLRYAEDNTLMAESQEELKSL